MNYAVSESTLFGVGESICESFGAVDASVCAVDGTL